MRADRSGPEMNQHGVAIECSDTDRPLDLIGKRNRKQSRRLDDLANSLLAGVEFANLVSDAISSAHIVAKNISIENQRVEYADDCRFRNVGLSMQVMQGGDAQTVQGTKHLQRFS